MLGFPPAIPTINFPHYSLPLLLFTVQDFDAWFNLSGGGLEKKDMIEKLHSLLKPFLLRRLKAEVEKDLPPKKETKIYVGLSKMQRQWYTKV